METDKGQNSISIKHLNSIVEFSLVLSSIICVSTAQVVNYITMTTFCRDIIASNQWLLIKLIICGESGFLPVVKTTSISSSSNFLVKCWWPKNVTRKDMLSQLYPLYSLRSYLPKTDWAKYLKRFAMLEFGGNMFILWKLSFWILCGRLKRGTATFLLPRAEIKSFCASVDAAETYWRQAALLCDKHG